MRKLQLQIEDLEVESFTTAARQASVGTVRGLDRAETYCDPPCTGATFCLDCVVTEGGDCAPSETCNNSVCCAATPNTHCVE